MRDTLNLWGLLKSGQFKAVISSLTLTELESCPEPKRTALLNHLAEIDYEKIQETSECIALSEEYLQDGVLRLKSRDDDDGL